MDQATKLCVRIITILALTGIFFTVLGIISQFQGVKIYPNQSYSYTHPNDNGYYRLIVEQGKYYCFSFNFSLFPQNLDPDIHLFSRSFKIVGVSGRSVVFYAQHSGNYYVTVTNSQGGFFLIHFDEINPTELTTSPYINPWKLTLLVIISGIFVIGMIFSIRMYKRNFINETEEIKRKNSVICPACGFVSKKGTEYCIICGYTFIKPKDFSEY